MKKIIVSLLALFALSYLYGCAIEEDSKKDENPAIVEIATSDGETFDFSSINGAGKNISGKRLAVYEYFSVDSASALVHFYCPSCEHDEIVELTNPDAKLFECDCPEEIDFSGNIKEYFAIVVGDEKTAEEAIAEELEP